MPIVQPGMIGGNQIIAIDTSMEAMQRDGLDGMEGGRPLRRRYVGGGPQFNLQLGPSMAPSMAPSMGPSMGSSMGVLTVTKLE